MRYNLGITHHAATKVDLDLLRNFVELLMDDCRSIDYIILKVEEQFDDLEMIMLDDVLLATYKYNMTIQ